MPKYFAKDVTVTIGGVKVRKKVRGKTKKELEEKVFELKTREKNGELETQKPTMTFFQWAKTFIETYKKNTVEEKEYKRYLTALNLYVAPSIGRIKLCDITHLNLQEYLNQFAGMSESQIDFHLKFIRACVRRAARNDLMTDTVILDLVPPLGTKGTRRALTNEERVAFFKAIKKHPRGLMFGIILACGIRPGEVRALLKDDVNIFNGEVKIFKAVKSSGKNRIGVPKTDAGVRIVKMPLWYLELYREYDKTNTSKYAFPSPTGEITTQQNIDRAWKSFKRLMDIEMGAKTYRNKVVESVIDKKLSPYYLRHTFCTDLATAGVPLKTAQYLMGHESPEITAKIYSHFQEETRDIAAEILNNFQLNKFMLDSAQNKSQNII